MRTVPASAPFMLKALRSTKHGRSDGPPSACHSTAVPSEPAIDVKVPHSCTVSASGSLARVGAAVAEKMAAAIAETTAATTECRITPSSHGPMSAQVGSGRRACQIAGRLESPNVSCRYERTRQVIVSSIVDVDAISPDDSQRITALIVAGLN